LYFINHHIIIALGSGFGFGAGFGSSGFLTAVLSIAVGLVSVFKTSFTFLSGLFLIVSFNS